MYRIIIFVFIILSFGVQIQSADLLADLQLNADAKEYVSKTHPDRFSEEARFDVPGPGFLRITYIDSFFNSDADSGGLSWRDVPGATTYAKLPGREIKITKEPEEPVSGTQYQFIVISEVEGPMKNIGVVLTPRHRTTWTGGGYQYATKLQVKVEWSPRQMDADKKTHPTPKKESTSQFVGIWTRMENNKVVDIVKITLTGSTYRATFHTSMNAPPYSTATGSLLGGKLNMHPIPANNASNIKIVMSVNQNTLNYSSYNPNGSLRWSGQFHKK